MRIRLVTAVLVGLATATLAATATGAAAKFRITEARSAGFPDRSYVLSLPREMQLKPGSVKVSENGSGVADLSVTAVGESRTKQFGVVLAVDASTSMEGEPERAAFAAARSFAAQRKGQEQLAVVTYNVAPTVALPFTTDRAKIDAALSNQPPFVFGTHIYDAVVHSLGLLRAGHISAGSIVILSDGQEHPGFGDTTEHETIESAAAAARAAHVRIFAVGLRSRVSQLAALKKLARDSGGSYVETTSIRRLRGIYKQLGSKLASEYLLQYRSLAPTGTQVEVRVRIAGVKGSAVSAYETPAVETVTPATKGPYQVSVPHRIWTSVVTTALVAILAAGLLGMGVFALLAGRPKKGTVRRRMAEFVTVPAAGGDRRQRPTAQLTDRMLEGTEAMLSGSSRWQRFKWELDVAQVKLPAEQIVVLTVIASLLGVLFAKVVVGSTVIGLLLAIAIPFAVRSLIKRDLMRKRAQFAEQLPDNLQVLSSALRAGHSFIGALSVVVADAPEPARSEFQRVIADEQLGIPVDQALHVVVERMGNKELEQVALVGALQRESGGNTAEVLDRVTDTIRERFELRRTVKTLTAQGRMSRWVLTLLPVSLFAFVSLINPGYMNILYTSTAGKVLLVFAAISVTTGSLLIKKIVNIKV